MTRKVEFEPGKSPSLPLSMLFLIGCTGYVIHSWWLSREPLDLLAAVAAIIGVGSLWGALRWSQSQRLLRLEYLAELPTLRFVELDGGEERNSELPLSGTPFRLEVAENDDLSLRGLAATAGLVEPRKPSTVLRLRNQRSTLELPPVTDDVAARVFAQTVNERPGHGSDLSDGGFDVDRSDDEATIRWTLTPPKGVRRAALLLLIALVAMTFALLPSFEESFLLPTMAMLVLLVFISLLARVPLRKEDRFATLRRVPNGIRLVAGGLDVVAAKPEVELMWSSGSPVLIVGKPRDEHGRQKRTGLVTGRAGATIHLAELLYTERDRLLSSEAGPKLADEDPGES